MLKFNIEGQKAYQNELQNNAIPSDNRLVQEIQKGLP